MDVEISAGVRALFNEGGLASLRKIIATAAKIAERICQPLASHWLVSNNPDVPLIDLSALLHLPESDDAEVCRIEFYIIQSEAPGIRTGDEIVLHLADGVLSTTIERPFPEG